MWYSESELSVRRGIESIAIFLFPRNSEQTSAHHWFKSYNRSQTQLTSGEWTSKKMTRRLFASHLRRLLNPATGPNPKPFSSPTSQQNHLSQSHLFSWQLKPNRSLYFSTYKPRGRQFLAQSSKTLPVMRFLTHGARSLSFSLQRRGGLGQIISSMRRFWYISLFHGI